MDWYLWLSKTSLDPLLTKKYGRIFTSNQLQEEDIPRFDHEFLQSLGISVAKHRLEILKQLSDQDSPKMSNIALAIKKTKSLFGKYWDRRRSTLLEHLRSKLWKKKDTQAHAHAHAVVYNNNNINRRILMQRSGPMERITKVVGDSRSTSRVRSGPLDRKMHERLMSTSWNATSSPVLVVSSTPHHEYRRTPQRLGCLNESYNTVGAKWSWSSPRFESQYHKDKEETISHDDNDELGSVWSLMFRDIKPT